MSATKIPEFPGGLILREYSRAVSKWGDRYPSNEIAFQVLMSEVEELKAAMDKNDLDGPHGVRIEAAQVAAVCIKIIESSRERGECDE